MPQGPGTYGKQVGRPKKKSPNTYTPFKMRGNPMQRNFPDAIKPMGDKEINPNESIEEKIDRKTDEKVDEKVEKVVNQTGDGITV